MERVVVASGWRGGNADRPPERRCGRQPVVGRKIVSVEHCETPVSAPDAGFSLMEWLVSLWAGAGCSTAKAFVLKTMAFVFTAEGSVFTAEGVSFTAAGSVFRAEGSALTAEGISVRKWPFP